ncbi:hypothetical protein VrSk94_40120 [Vibrio rotiferianus]
MDVTVSKTDLPEELIHIVPIDLYHRFTDCNGVYDPRNKFEFGGNSPFIHTTPSIEQLTKYLSYYKAIDDPEFYLIKISTSMLGDERFTYRTENGRVYHHLWCSLSQDSFRRFLVSKSEGGDLKFLKEYDVK